MSQSANRVLDALAATDFSVLAPHLKDVALGARQVLHDVQDEPGSIYFPTGGLVSLIVVTEDGEMIETTSVGIDGAVGLHAIFGIPRAPARAIVQIAGTAQRIPVATLRHAARERPSLNDALARTEQRMAVQVQLTGACNALHRVERRLARWLLQAHDRTGNPVISIIQESLAQALGVRRTTVNLVVGALQQSGAIRYRRGRVEIVDRAQLSAECCSCYEAIRGHLADDENERQPDARRVSGNQSSR